jgi:hypothetical protein
MLESGIETCTCIALQHQTGIPATVTKKAIEKVKKKV